MTEESVKKLLFAAMGLAIVLVLVMLTHLPKAPIDTTSEETNLDVDDDGLTDDLERILGTDVNQKDTDGDGYDDLTELQKGFNPLDGASESKLSEKDFTVIKNKIEEVDSVFYANNF
ncbi:MAG: hypothetical protein WC178_02100 [Candidatus Paceibacterota bacterium]